MPPPKETNLFTAQVNQLRVFCTHWTFFWWALESVANEAPSDINTTLDGSPYPGWKMFRFCLLMFSFANENGTGYFWDQCCHLQGDGASLKWFSCKMRSNSRPLSHEETLLTAKPLSPRSNDSKLACTCNFALAMALFNRSISLASSSDGSSMLIDTNTSLPLDMLELMES